MIKWFKQLWRELGQSIYVGERRESNLNAITVVSLLSAALGIVMIAVNTGKTSGLITATSWMFLFAGMTSAIAAGIYRARKVSVVVAILTSVVVFTFYAISGAMNGFSVVWAMVMPIGVCYFLSVKYGIFVSLYYELLCIVLFYTPLREYMAQYYSEVVMTRFPIVYLTLISFTIVAMVQYHRLVLKDNAYAERLNAEVEKQTAVATERAKKLERMSAETVNTLAIAIDAKDRYTNGHSFRVAAYSVALARRLGWREDEISAIKREALLHDIGKIGVSDLVLNKPGRLTHEEFEIIKSHSTIGGKILDASDSLKGAANVARYHHERYNGSGYPAGLKGEEIPLHARVVAIADAYDAMRSDRIYRKGLSKEVIREELVNGKGGQFDPDMLDVFVQLADEGELDAVTENANKHLSTAIELGLIEEQLSEGMREQMAIERKIR